MQRQGVFGIMKWIGSDNRGPTKLYWSGEAWTSNEEHAICFDNPMNCIDYVIFMELVDEWLLVEGNNNRWFNGNHLVTRKVFK